MKWFIPLAAFRFLSASSPQGEKGYTVDELINAGALLTNIISECRNNPGRLPNTPIASTRRPPTARSASSECASR
jgi:hypothetical protein